MLDSTPPEHTRKLSAGVRESAATIIASRLLGRGFQNFDDLYLARDLARGAGHRENEKILSALLNLVSCKAEKPEMIDLGGDLRLIHTSAALTKFHSCRQSTCPANGYEVGQRLADGIRTLLDSLTDGRVYLVTTTPQTSADLRGMIATAYTGLHDVLDAIRPHDGRYLGHVLETPIKWAASATSARWWPNLHALIWLPASAPAIDAAQIVSAADVDMRELVTGEDRERGINYVVKSLTGQRTVVGKLLDPASSVNPRELIAMVHHFRDNPEMAHLEDLLIAWWTAVHSPSARLSRLKRKGGITVMAGVARLPRKLPEDTTHRARKFSGWHDYDKQRDTRRAAG